MHSPMGAHGPMGMHAGDQMGFGRGGYGMGVPLIPAPVAFMTMLFGLMIGMMIGRKKAMMMQGMGGMGHGMGMGGCGGGGMGGMGHGMGVGGCGGGWSDWAMKKKMMGGGGMPMHHHHGEGMPACGCGSADVSGADEGSSEE